MSVLVRSVVGPLAILTGFLAESAAAQQWPSPGQQVIHNASRGDRQLTTGSIPPMTVRSATAAAIQRPVAAAPAPRPAAPIPTRQAEPAIPAMDLFFLTNAARYTGIPFRSGKQDPAVLRLQIMLDRVHASPGAIDGYWGGNVQKAVKAAREMYGLPVRETVDEQLWTVLEQADPSPPLKRYVLTAADVAGPFVPQIPTDYAELAQLERIAYRNPQEALGEKFHMDEKLLRQLNPNARFVAGEEILVTNVGKPSTAKISYLIADKERRQLLGYGADARLLVAYPATIGSTSTPSPVGIHAVKAIAVDAEYWYRPQVNFQQGQNAKPLRLAPGPNNPIGAVWIGLDRPTFGIHGTPEPSRIDKTNSHGCIRLTNWDVLELVKLVKPGVTVEFYQPSHMVGSAN